MAIAPTVELKARLRLPLGMTTLTRARDMLAARRASAQDDLTEAKRRVVYLTGLIEQIDADDAETVAALEVLAAAPMDIARA